MNDAGAQITTSLRWRKRTNNIELNMRKKCIWSGDSSKGNDNVTVYFGELARKP